MQKNSLSNKTPQPSPLDHKSLLGPQTREKCEIWRLCPPGRDLRAFMHDIDLLLHSWENPRHFTHYKCTSACMMHPGKTPRYTLYALYIWLCMCVCSFLHVFCVCFWNDPSTAHLLNNLTCLEYFYMCQHGTQCVSLLYTHTYAHSHPAISEVLAECTRLFPVDKHGWDALWSPGAESVFLCSCQGVPLTFWVGIFNPDLFFFCQFLGVRNLLPFHFWQLLALQMLHTRSLCLGL